MAAMGKAELWALVDVLGEEYAALSGPENEAARHSKKIQLFNTLYRAISTQETRDALGEFYIRDFSDYDPEKGKFSSFLRARLKFREADVHYMDYTYQTVRETDPNSGRQVRRRRRADSLNVPVGGDGSDGTERFKLLVDEEAWRPFEAVESEHGNALMQRLTAVMLTISERLHGKANNPTRIMYFRLFFTAGVTDFLKQNPADAERYRIHERELFEAMKLTFLDYYMAQICRTAPQIANGNLKRYCELVSGRPMDQEPGTPLPADVYLAYLERVEGYQAKAAALSQQRAAFREFLRDTGLLEV